MRDLYDIARQVTDEVFGEGSYAELNQHNPDPQVQAAIKRAGKNSDERKTEIKENNDNE